MSNALATRPNTATYAPVGTDVFSSTRVAYLVSRFPKITETFILNEILALQDAGEELTIYPLNLEHRGLYQPRVELVAARVRYTSYMSPRCLAAFAYYLRHTPRSVASTLATVVRENVSSPRFLIRSLALFAKSLAIARQMRAARIEHIHAHFATHATTAAYIIHRMTGIPYSFTAHAHDIYVDKHMLREKARAARAIVTVSERNRRAILRHCGASVAGKTMVVRNGVDADRFMPGMLRVTDSDDCLNVLCVGALEEKKGQRYLIDACDLLRRRGIAVRCILVGDGPLRDVLRRQIGALGLDDCVELVGALIHDDVAIYMRAADIVVLPSTVTSSGKTEGLPVALTEALACERPVVATRVAGVPEIVIDGVTGLLVEPRDARGLADALIRLRDNPALRQQLGVAGRRKVIAEYDPASNVALLRSVFRMGKR